jgi:propionyl-CoA carboxylase alpha chain
MFQKILIANRGEIACRVIKTARRMGIATVAVYSDADREARHVELADEAVHIGPPPARESYLVMDRIIAACRQTGAQAVHPGYGFLSENAEFSRKVEEAGIVFIGPKHRSIAAMGDKIASKKLAKAARVNVIPGWNEPIETAEQAVSIAKDIGYPVMIKASAGGGGKGLRVAFDDREAFEGFTSCRNEARNSFGDDRVFIEKFIEEPRHIEIQVLGDAHGNVVYLHERECSIQRRHQKLIEEAPSAFLDRDTARRMGEQAVALAKAVDYQSAGTVEFVVGKDKGFYFLEMNTRLQVEHPVTECITGLDLVEQMIRVAAGEPLAFAQQDVGLDGWAIECRINAEDPSRGFLPSTGRLVRFQPPATSMEAASPVPAEGGVRVDTGVYEGGEIPMQYDSMIAKLVVKGRDRAEAIRRMRHALDAFVIRGISNNVGFQSALIGHPRFASVEFNTGFVAEHYPDGYRADGARHDDAAFLLALAGAAHRRLRERAAGIEGQLHGRAVIVPTEFVAVVRDADGHRHDTPVAVTPDGATLHVVVGASGDAAVPGGADRGAVAGGAKRYAIRFDGPIRDVAVHGEANGARFSAQVERKGLDYHVAQGGAQVVARMLSARAAGLNRLMPEKQPPDLSRFLLSPMPGLLVDVAVKPGQQVRAGERLAVIEAMKMENVLLAQRDAIVKTVAAGKGESLAVDQVILEFE